MRAPLRKKWADQVRRTVRRTTDKWTPTDTSQLCSRHFEDSCFEPDIKLSEAMGLGKRNAHLVANAISGTKRRRIAYEKREITRVSSAKVLQVLRIYGCASISYRTYFRHQGSFLQPAICTTRNKHQADLFKQLDAR